MRSAHSPPVALVAFVAALVSVASSACMREGAPVLAPVEANDNNDAGPAAAIVVSSPPPPPRDQCTARLRALPIKTGDKCTLDERISQGNGMLLYPCSGEGTFEAVFAEHRFQGKLTGSTLELTLTTELDWEDHCHWETQQRIRGPWKADSPTHPKLIWSYSEAPVQGTGCLGACIAKAEIEVDQLSTDR